MYKPRRKHTWDSPLISNSNIDCDQQLKSEHGKQILYHRDLLLFSIFDDEEVSVCNKTAKCYNDTIKYKGVGYYGRADV